MTDVFGLTKPQLAPVVRSLSGEETGEFEVEVARALPAEDWGDACDPALLRFTFTSRGGARRSVDVFAKRYRHAGAREARHYAWLSRLAAPVPRYHGSLLGPGDREILFLECIDAPNHDDEVYLNETTCRSFLSALARFNATRPPAAVQSLLPEQDWALRLGSADAWNDRRAYWPAGRVLEAIREHELRAPRDDGLGRFCRSPRAWLDEIRRGAGALVEPIRRLERGLVHDDFRAAQTGWRTHPREIVIYDLEFLGLGPRFHDVATVLGEPDRDRTFCLPRPELARVYLDAYARAGGKASPVGPFLEEVRLLHLAHRLSVLGWWLGYVYDAPASFGAAGSPREALSATRRDELHAWLLFLLAGVAPYLASAVRGARDPGV